MADLSITRPHAAPTGLIAFFAAFIAWKDARATRKALSALTDRELEDIGLNRADIDRVAKAC
ncbi:DUF1127 domain-containing protein [Roseovarius sp. A21]|uniref:DUF1127 domain-containing protein n=1 Tax=Roseovarius bejariae TaxID=2576383 RepID=A0A844CZN7_9RHOB|nr:DUF1127 domain-containing protein [Roseovarius bejariae]MRU16060.1 DUF1127 domain-containing protein [Roseovarius bejariae]